MTKELRISLEEILFITATYSELRDRGSDLKMRKWVVSRLIPNDGIEPISPLEFGYYPSQMINNGGKKFSGLMASVVDYYEQNGIAEFDGDQDKYVRFLQNTYVFDDSMLQECQKQNYQPLAVAHTAEHAADTAALLAKYTVESNLQKAVEWYQSSLRLRGTAEGIYQSSDHPVLNIHQSRLNNAVRAMELANQLASQKEKTVSRETTESDIWIDAAVFSLGAFNYRKENERAIQVSLDQRKGETEGSRSYGRTRRFFEEKIALQSMIALGYRYRDQVLSVRDRMVHNLADKIDSDEVKNMLKIASGLYSFTFLLSTGESDLLSEATDVGSEIHGLLQDVEKISDSDNKLMNQIDKIVSELTYREGPVKVARDRLIKKHRGFKQLRFALKKSLELSKGNQRPTYINGERLHAMAGYTGLI